MSAFLSQLKSILKPDQISEDPSDLENYGRDWTRVFRPQAKALLFPESTEQVATLVRLAYEACGNSGGPSESVSLVPSGGRTGLSGGAVAAGGEYIVSMDRFNRILEFYEEDQTIVCEAGVPTQALQEFVRAKGYYFPVDFASRGSSQIGGNISTNAGGTKVIRYGMMREWVAGLKVVNGRGEILDMMKALRKDNSGYDLKQLFIGAEGTLGFVCEAALRVTKSPGDLKVMVLAASSLDIALRLLKAAQQSFELFGFEFFSHQALERVCRQHCKDFLFEKSSPYYFLIEARADTDFLGFFDRVSAWPEIENAVLSQTDKQAEDFWAYRELISETIAPLKPYKSDISVPIRHIPDFVREAEKMIRERYESRPLIWFGHIGDGNLHFNFLPREGENGELFQKACEPLSHELFALLKNFGGSISAEHGIGLLKKPYLSYSRSSEEIALMRELKKIFDPRGVLNPGKIF